MYQLLDPTNAIQVLDEPLPLPTAANGNGIGLVDFVKDYVVFSEPNNGIMLYQLTDIVINTPPTVSVPAK